MPLHQWECPDHGEFEESFKIADKPKYCPCPECGKASRQVVTIGAILGDEAAWLNSVCEVVDPEGGAHCQQFLNNPTRSNYKKWMKESNLRPLEPGEERRRKPTAADRERAKKERTDSAMKALHEARKVTVKP